MCGRYTLTTVDGRLVAERFVGSRREAVGASALGRFNVCPGEQVLAIDCERRPVMLDWGLPRPGRRAAAVINARAETAAARPLFAPLIESAQGRCLVPADGWYEWLRAESRRVRPTPFRHTVDGGGPFAFAGLRTRDAVVLLTTEPNDVCARLHDRMPCVLADEEAEAAWLDPRAGAGEVAELLRAVASDRISVAAASPEVNRAGREGPELLEPEPTLF